MERKTVVLGAVLMAWLAAAGGGAAETFPKEGWQEAPDPLASEFAEKGGQLVVYMGPYPKSFNYYL